MYSNISGDYRKILDFEQNDRPVYKHLEAEKFILYSSGIKMILLYFNCSFFIKTFVVLQMVFGISQMINMPTTGTSKACLRMHYSSLNMAGATMTMDILREQILYKIPKAGILSALMTKTNILLENKYLTSKTNFNDSKLLLKTSFHGNVQKHVTLLNLLNF